MEGKCNRRKRSMSAAAPREKKEEVVKEGKKKGGGGGNKYKEYKKQRGNTDTSIHCHDKSIPRSLKDNSHRSQEGFECTTEKAMASASLRAGQPTQTAQVALADNTD